MDYGNTKTLHTGKKQKHCSLSPGKAARISRALHWDKKIILSYLILSYLILPSTPEEQEPLQEAEEWNVHLEDVLFVTEVPGVSSKRDQPEAILRSLSLEMLPDNYNTSVWTHAYTDGSSDAALRNGESGIFIHHPGRRTTSSSLPVGRLSASYRAETTALREAARLISAEDPPPSHVVFLTDCRSVIQSLLSPSEQLESDTRRLLTALSQRVKVAVQWIPAHCGLSGIEKADKLAKSGSRQEQPNKSVSYSEAKALVKRQLNAHWQAQHSPSRQGHNVYQISY